MKFITPLLCSLTGVFTACLQAENQFIRTAVEPLLKHGDPVAISIGMVKKGQAIEFHHGQLSLDQNTNPDSDTLYEIGSVTKVFTAMLLAHEVLEREITLDTPVAELLPESWNTPSFNNQPIRLKHLATHTSRLPRIPPDLFREANRRNPYAHYNSDRLRHSLAQQKLSAAPGGKPVQYSNFGFGLLGHALAHKNQTTYPNLLTKTWLKPLGMKSTCITPPGNAKRAQGYDLSHHPQSNWTFDALAGAGAIHSNLNDMMRFARYCLNTDSKIHSKAFELTTQPQVQTKHFTQCLGWIRARDQSTYWHNGQTGGFTSYFAFNKKHQVAVCILSTGSSPYITAMGEHLVACAARDQTSPCKLNAPKHNAPTTPQQLAKLTGKYQLSPQFIFTVKTRNNRLFVQLTGQPYLEVFADSATVFQYKAVKAKLEFSPGKSLTLFQNGTVQSAKKLP